MKAHTAVARLSGKESEQLEAYIRRKACEIAAEAVEISTQNVFLQTLWYFYNEKGYGPKRISDICKGLMDQKEYLDSLYNEQTMVAFILERMKADGIDLYSTFEKLLKNEEERFAVITKAEQIKRENSFNAEKRKREQHCAKLLNRTTYAKNII